MDTEKANQGKVTGVIIPPPEIRAVVDKTAQFVGKNGKSFEQRILDSGEGKTAKFNFMRSFDPYHAYYEMKIREVEDALANGGTLPIAAKPVAPAPTQAAAAAPVQATPVAAAPPISTTVKASLLNPIARILKNKSSDPPRPFEFTLPTPTGITAEDVEVIKLTAQYTAVNGREFLAGVATREQHNPQFDFLKPTHMLFSYFTALVDSYMKILNPTAEMVASIQRMTLLDNVLESAVHRWDHTKSEEIRKHREEGMADEERLAFQQIDWQEFSVVETIDFPANELFELPGLATFGLNGSSAPAPPASGVRHPQAVPPPRQPAPSARQLEEDDPDIKLVSDYKPRIAGSTGAPAAAAAALMRDPVSGKMVPVSQISEHMRVQLLDPKWQEEQKRFQDKQKETGIAAGESIADSLKTFARQRGDIFGQATAGSGDNTAAAISGEQAAQQARYADSVQWDGHTASVSTFQSQKANQAASFAARGLLPPPPAAPAVIIGPSATAPPPPAPYAGAYFPPPMAPAMPVPAFPPMAPTATAAMMYGAPPRVEYGEPSSKKAKVEAVLMSADEFAARFPSPITLVVSVPSDPQFGGASGRTVSLPGLAITATVKDVKDLLSSQHLGGLPSSKQQLKSAALGFLKDTSSLASLNFTSSTVVELVGKSRGGKK